jgi:hypothetical protein
MFCGELFTRGEKLEVDLLDYCCRDTAFYGILEHNAVAVVLLGNCGKSEFRI